jgi:N-acetylmuramoyl-L-alanine amidase
VNVLDPDWFSDCTMEKIVVHWTAGSYSVSSYDKDHYHFLIDNHGVGHKGTNPVSGNARNNPKGKVTSHVKNMNTGSIGITVCAMAEAIENPFNAGPYPITQEQWDGLMLAVAQLADFYEIGVAPDRILMHGEVQQNCGVQQDGKWDIGRLPFKLELKNSRACGDYMRSLVSDILSGAPEPAPEETTATVEFTFRDGVVTAVRLVE